MKLISFLMLVIASSTMGRSIAGSRPISENEVPAPVLERFKSAYPGATNVKVEVEHEKHNKKEYEFVFEQNGKKHKTEFEFDGIGVVEDKED